MHSFFFFNDTATTEIYTLSLHDALPICLVVEEGPHRLLVREIDQAVVADHDLLHAAVRVLDDVDALADGGLADRKSTRLNSSHANISYAVFCLKKKKKYLVLSI